MKLLCWPCRLLAVDLGVDAEVEVLDDNGESTGDIIRLQIKSTEKHDGGEKLSIPTDERHVTYWKKYCAPIVFIGVDLNTETIYWRQITSIGNYDTNGESKKIEFCTKHQVLTAETKDDWRKLVTPDNFADLQPLFQQIHDALDQTRAEPVGGVAGTDHFVILDKAEIAVRKIREIISYHPWKISGLELERFNQLLSMLNARRIEASAAITGDFS